MEGFLDRIFPASIVVILVFMLGLMATVVVQAILDMQRQDDCAVSCAPSAFDVRAGRCYCDQSMEFAGSCQGVE